MFGAFPKDDGRMRWTRHVKNKMLFYGLSAQRIKRVIASPDRQETGIAERTVAAMQRVKHKKRAEEIWVMYQHERAQSKGHQSRFKGQRKIVLISAWRYPGLTKPGAPIPVPDDILEALST